MNETLKIAIEELDGENREPTPIEQQFHAAGIAAVEAVYGFDQASIQEAYPHAKEIIDEIRSSHRRHVANGLLLSPEDRMRAL